VQSLALTTTCLLHQTHLSVDIYGQELFKLSVVVADGMVDVILLTILVDPELVCCMLQEKLPITWTILVHHTPHILNFLPTLNL
jgi:hypothetical protein